MHKPCYILGISESHNASAAILKDGQVIAAASEERFTRKKNQAGTPKNAIAFCLDFAKINFNDLTQVAVADIYPPFQNRETSPYALFTPPLPFFLETLLAFQEKVELAFPNLQKIFYHLYKLGVIFKLLPAKLKRLKNLQSVIPLPKDKFTFLNHHLCHASSALFSSPFLSDNLPSLIFTCDGVGDFESATIYKYHRGEIKKLTSIGFPQSLGFFYQHITQLLGLKPVEDEHKVMGLAAYTDKDRAREVCELLSPFFKINKLENKWTISISEYLIWRKLPKLLRFKRFDDIAFAVQHILEKVITEWVRNTTTTYQISNIALGGGVFANVKVNQKVASLDCVNQVFFMPSPGDESNAIGAAQNLYFQLTKNLPAPINNLYLGPSYSKQEIDEAIQKLLHNKNFSVEKPRDINDRAAKLLARGEVVARFAGRLEMGARALGNRSLLANPSNLYSTQFINSSIKSRDFWMPFAPTILKKRVKDYLNLHKGHSFFMNIAYNTTSKARRELAAAIHQYDATTRPQILDRNINPSYYDLIEKFEKITGIGAVLNTSFNLHGQPIVTSPEDAIKVFISSGLKFMILESYLITKKASI